MNFIYERILSIFNFYDVSQFHCINENSFNDIMNFMYKTNSQNFCLCEVSQFLCIRKKLFIDIIKFIFLNYVEMKYCQLYLECKSVLNLIICIDRLERFWILLVILIPISICSATPQKIIKQIWSNGGSFRK